MSCKLHSFASIMMLHLWPPRNREREWRSSFHCQNKKFSMENKYQNFLSLCTPCWSSYNNLIVYLETAQLATHSQTNQHIWYLWLFFFEINLKGILHQNKFYRLNLIFWIVMGCGHTWYLSFFLHEQNFWRIKFTPKKRVYYDKIHSKLPIFCVITAKYTVNCQFFVLNL